MAAEGPLADLKLIDLAIARAGPTCVRALADLGADVVGGIVGALLAMQLARRAARHRG